MGFAVNASTHRHGDRRARRSRSSAGASTGALGIVASLGAALDPDGAARRRARPRHLHRACASRRACAWPTAFALTLSYLGEHCSAGGRRRRLRRLHHRQRREQPVRPPDGGRARRPSRPRRQLLRLRRAQPRRRGAGLVLPRARTPRCRPSARRAALAARDAGREHLRNPALRASFAIGFCILFAFIGTFTYVNFVLVREPLSLSPDGARASSTSCSCRRSSPRRWPAARSRASARGRRSGARSALAGAGLPLLRRAEPARGARRPGAGRRRAPSSRRRPPPASSAAPRPTDRGSASGIYLACYFFGGLVGTAVLGQLFDRLGWAACVAGIGAALAVGGAARLSG